MTHFPFQQQKKFKKKTLEESRLDPILQEGTRNFRRTFNDILDFIMYMNYTKRKNYTKCLNPFTNKEF